MAAVARVARGAAVGGAALLARRRDDLGGRGGRSGRVDRERKVSKDSRGGSASRDESGAEAQGWQQWQE